MAGSNVVGVAPLQTMRLAEPATPCSRAMPAISPPLVRKNAWPEFSGAGNGIAAGLAALSNAGTEFSPIRSVQTTTPESSIAPICQGPTPGV